MYTGTFLLHCHHKYNDNNHNYNNDDDYNAETSHNNHRLEAKHHTHKQVSKFTDTQKFLQF